MTTTTIRDPEQRLTEVKQRLDQWRRDGRPGRSIPEELWRAAAALHPELSLSRISKALGLNYTALRKRAADATTRRKSQKDGFLEISPEVLFGSQVPGGPAIKVELRDGVGNRMTVHLPGGEVRGLEVLVRAFRGEARCYS